MSEFATQIKNWGTKTRTENNAICYNTTNSGLVDLFGMIGALRGSPDERLYELIDCAYNEDKTLLAKMLFYARDVRGGLGERDTFKRAIKYCARFYPEIVSYNMQFIPEYGRWDDLFALMDTPLERDMFKYVRSTLESEYNLVMSGEPPKTLLTKHLPTADASSYNTREYAKRVSKGLGFKNVRDYKDMYKPVRKALNTVESLMSANKWGDIDYEHVPSRSMLTHKNAFNRHDEKRYNEYLDGVRTGKSTMHTNTLYPYDIIRKVLKEDRDTSLDVMWRNLPNYIDNESNVLVMADTSGSMTEPNLMPISSALGLAIYFAQRNKGVFHNCFMSFSHSPKIHTIKDGYSISRIVNTIDMSDWGMNTNLESAFDTILKIAIDTHCKQEELPKSLIVISDTEFDRATSWDDCTFFDAMTDKYKEYGYEMPNVVFWNVNSRHNTIHVKEDARNVQLVSGSSASTFRNVISCINFTPYETMMKTLSDKRYDCISTSLLKDIRSDAIQSVPFDTSRYI